MLLALGCAAGQERPEPPSGAVDPGAHGLAPAGQDPRSSPPPAAPAGAPLAAPSGGVIPSLPPAPAAPPAPSARTGEARGNMVMTRAHCETLGRRFSEIAVAQAGATGMVREAENVGKIFTDRCAREMVGQTVEVREYECMLRAEGAEQLLDCKR